MNATHAHDERIANLTFASVYPMYIAKVEKKGRTKKELLQVIEWLTGFDDKQLQKLANEKVTFKTFFERARLNPNASLITGVICGYRIEEISTPLTKKARYLDKLVDELAQGRKMEKILRSPNGAEKDKAPLGKTTNATIKSYNEKQPAAARDICKHLATAIDKHLKGAESKIWHAHPVWFINGNPIVGYSKLKDCIRLLFWSGQSFEEEKLKKEGSFKAAEIRYTATTQINLKDLARWLKKGKKIQWDYKNIVKRRGKLERLP